MTQEKYQAYKEKYTRQIEEIRLAAHELHQSVNDTYGDNLPYGVHLDMVAEGVSRYGHLVCVCEEDVVPLFFGSYFHDSIEDARTTYNDVMKIALRWMTEKQAQMATEIVYAVTNDKGRTRTERAGEKYFEGIRKTPYAPFVKLCDRLANVTYSCSTDNDRDSDRMKAVYKSEMSTFLPSLYSNSDDPRLQIPFEVVTALAKILSVEVECDDISKPCGRVSNLSPNGELLLSDFSKLRPQLEQLSEAVYTLLCRVLKEQGIELNAIEYRVKTEQSLMGKLERKGDKYHRLDNITDLVGLRIVTFYADDVDKVAAIVKSLFDVDWQNSVDKRKLHQLTSFGYNSLHYICRLKESQQSIVCSKDTATMPFEIQMRTALQHAWSAIEHDIGYKGAVKLPPEFRRQFSRLAGMLELIDDEFSRLRTTMTDYRRQVEALVKSGQLSDVPLSTDSFRSYLDLHPFERLNQRIAAVNQAEIYPASLMTFLPLLESFGMETLDDVQQFIDNNSDDAYQLALSQLAVTDLDILSESVGLLNLCLVYVLKHNGGLNGLRHVYDIINGKHDSNEIMAAAVLQQAQSLLLGNHT